eukprot:6475830-Amphidinium_carterae.1
MWQMRKPKLTTPSTTSGWVHAIPQAISSCACLDQAPRNRPRVPLSANTRRKASITPVRCPSGATSPALRIEWVITSESEKP